MVKINWTIERVFVLDCGKNAATLYNPITNEVTALSHEEVLELYKKLPEGSTLVSENSHLGTPRRKRSLSQPFTAEQLLEFYENCNNNNISIKLFPQKSTPRALGFTAEMMKAGKSQLLPCLEGLADGKGKGMSAKDDLFDPWAIWVFLKYHPSTSMRNPPTDFDSNPLLAGAHDYKDHTNYLCNVARSFGYSDRISNWIKDNIDYIHDHLSEDARNCFNFQKYKTGKSGQYEAGDIKVGKHGSWTLKMPQLFSVAATLIDEDGKDRVRKETQESPGWGYVKRHVLCMSPFHLKGGTARSTLYYHGAKSWISSRIDNQLDIKDTKKCARGGMINTDSTKEGKKAFTAEQEDEFRVSRKIYSNSIREVFQLFKRMRANNM